MLHLIAQFVIYLPLVLSGDQSPIMLPVPPITTTISVSDFNNDPSVEFADMIMFEDGSGGLDVTWADGRAERFMACVIPEYGCGDSAIVTPFIWDPDACVLTVFPPDWGFGVFDGFNCDNWPEFSQ